MGDTEDLSLTSAAEALGVHYQTAYRWVRTGRLPAAKVDGQYLVARADLEELTQARATPTPPPVPDAQGIAAKAERLRVALVDGDERAVGQIARSLVARGAPVKDLITFGLAPALRRIGDDWEGGRLDIGAEHRASAIVERLLGELAPNPRGRRRGVAVVASIEGDRHTLPTTMAAVALREDHWTVHHLGADMPVAALTSFLRAESADLLVITVTTPGATPAAESAAATIEALGIPVVVGAPGRTLDDLIDAARAATVDRRGAGEGTRSSVAND